MATTMSSDVNEDIMGRHANTASRGRTVPLAIAGVLVATALIVAGIKFGPSVFSGADKTSGSAVASSASETSAAPSNSQQSSTSEVSSTSSVAASSPSSGSSETQAATSTTTTTPAAPTCPEKSLVRVAAAGGIVPVLNDVSPDACVDLQVTVVEGTGGAALLAAGQVDAWVPDSRENAYAAGEEVAATSVSTAMSPLILAAAAETAAGLTANGPVSWGILLSPNAVAPLAFEMPSAQSSGAAMAVTGKLVEAATAATGDKYVALAAVAGATRSIAPLDAAGLDQIIAPDRIRMMEQRQLFNSTGSQVGVALPLVEGVPTLEYPWVMPAAPADPAVAQGAERMITALAGTAGSTSRQMHGFFEPASGTVSSAGGDAQVLSAIAGSEVRNLFGLMGSGLRYGNTLAVLDVSGSMGDMAPGATLSPIEGVRTSANLMIGMLQDNTKLGLWEFGEQLAPPNDYQELIPLGPLATNRQTFVERLPTVLARPSGTALYNTVLGSYQALQAQYDPNATNLLAIFTDGRNQDVIGMDLAGLLAQLQLVADPARPIGVLFFGYGDVDLDAMQQIVGVTGGGVWSITTPEQIIGAFIEATGRTAVFN